MTARYATRVEKLGAELTWNMLELLKTAPKGASVIGGGGVIKADAGWTPEKIDQAQKICTDVMNLPVDPGVPVIWRDRVVRRKT